MANGLREILQVVSRIGLQALPLLCDAYATFSVRIAAGFVGAANEASSATRPAALFGLVLWTAATLVTTVYILLKTKVLFLGAQQKHVGRWSGYVEARSARSLC